MALLITRRIQDPGERWEWPGWEKDSKQPAHKDIDARWTQKNDVNFHGDKDHVVADLESKLSVRAEVTKAKPTGGRVATKWPPTLVDPRTASRARGQRSSSTGVRKPMLQFGRGLLEIRDAGHPLKFSGIGGDRIARPCQT